MALPCAAWRHFCLSNVQALARPSAALISLPCSEKLDVVRLTFYTAPVSLVCLAPFFWIYEVGGRSFAA